MLIQEESILMLFMNFKINDRIKGKNKINSTIMLQYCRNSCNFSFINQVLLDSESSQCFKMISGSKSPSGITYVPAYSNTLDIAESVNARLRKSEHKLCHSKLYEKNCYLIILGDKEGNIYTGIDNSPKCEGKPLNNQSTNRQRFLVLGHNLLKQINKCKLLNLNNMMNNKFRGRKENINAQSVSVILPIPDAE